MSVLSKLGQLVIPGEHGIVVAGPTASGKSRLALERAMIEGGVILNGDSMQLYEGLPLLTALPSFQDQHSVPHYFYGIWSYRFQEASAYLWASMVEQQMEALKGKGKRIWIVGGTGLYLRILLQGLCPIPRIGIETKIQFRNSHEGWTANELKNTLHKVDPETAHRFQDKQRMLYALMIHRETGKSLSQWQKEKSTALCPFFYRILLWPSLDSLMEQAMKRWDRMVDQGLFQEVTAFCQREGWEESKLRKAIGFQELVEHRNGNFSLCKARYAQAIRGYIKRQRTWFRHQFAPHWVIPHVFPHP